MQVLITTSEMESKMAAVEGDHNASIITQLVKQKSKWAAIEDGDHNARITSHIEKTESNAGTTKLQRVRTTRLYNSDPIHPTLIYVLGRNMNKIRLFIWKFSIVGCRFSIYLNRRVFEMKLQTLERLSSLDQTR